MMIFFCTISAKRGLVGYLFFFASLKLVCPWLLILMKQKFDSLIRDPEMAYYSTNIERWKF